MEVDKPELRSFRAVAGGPHPIVKRMNAFVTNGYHFHTRKRDKSRKLKILGLWWKLKAKHIMEKFLISLS